MAPKSFNFFGIFWPNYENLEYLQHERFDSFEVGGIPVIVKLDLLSKSPDGQVVVTDWKTGHEDDAADTSLQLGAYVLWAQHKFDLQPDRIKAELAFLETGRTRVTSRTPLELAQLRQFIVRSGGGMMTVQEEAQLPASPEERKCRGCRFATACAEGRAFLRNPKNPYR